MSYGIVKSGSAILATVPNLKREDGYLNKTFSPSKWHDTKSAAVLWRDKIGRELWGSKRWDLICTKGIVSRLRSPIFGVSVYDTVSGGKWRVWCVSWRNEGKKHVEYFTPKRFGTLEQAEIEANRFAAYKRAELTGGELNLPSGLSCFN